MFHFQFPSQDLPSHFMLTSEELLVDMELTSTKKELDSLFLSEPDSVLDLGAHISPLNSPGSDNYSTCFNAPGFSDDEPWPFDERMEDMNFELDQLSCDHSFNPTSSSDISHQDSFDEKSEQNELKILEDMLLDDESFEHSRQQLEKPQQDSEEGSDGVYISHEERGLEIVHLLLACVERIQEGNIDASRLILDHLAASCDNLQPQLATPIERVSTHIVRALRQRIAKEALFDTTKNKHLSVEEAEELAIARRALYQHFPFLKFAHFTANQAILEALRGYSKLHIVDLDVDQGMQWPNLIQFLSQLPAEAVPSLRITGVGSDFDELCRTGHRLAEFAASVGYNKFEYHSVRVDSPDQLDPSAFSIAPRSDDSQEQLDDRPGLAVNCSMFLHRLLGNQPALERTLSMIRSWKPQIVAVSEMEANHNAPGFVDRFVEALHFYSAVFDCLESALPRGDADRLWIEQALLAMEITNILACEGGDRTVRHARIENWRDLMQWSGFKEVALSDHSLYQAHVFLTLYSPAYRLSREAQALILGWHDTPVVSISTWSC